MSTAANWTALGVNGLLAVITFSLLRPIKGVFEADHAWGLLLFGYTASVVRFVAEALKFGRWPELPTVYATNWVRYAGAGLGTVGLLGSMVALCRGGVRQLLYTMVGVASYYALFTFAALAFTDDAGERGAVIAFYVIGAVLFLGTLSIYYTHSEYGRKSLPRWIPAVSFLLETGMVAMTAINVIHRHTASSIAEDWVFASLSIANGVWYLLVYLGGVSGFALFQLETVYVPAAGGVNAY